jgi:hypothetical protein
LTVVDDESEMGKPTIPRDIPPLHGEPLTDKVSPDEYFKDKESLAEYGELFRHSPTYPKPVVDFRLQYQASRQQSRSGNGS